MILVGVIALIIFGPRKLPEMMRTFGKAMAEFRRSTNEFKESWEREVSFDDLAKAEPPKKILSESDSAAPIASGTIPSGEETAAPEIREIDESDIESAFPGAVSAASRTSEPDEQETAAKNGTVAEIDTNSKQSWL